MSKETSTLEYLSNLQPIDISLANDVDFMSNIHDPFALEKIDELINQGKINYTLTEIQYKEMRSASKHCAYAFKDDYPWGTIQTSEGKKVVCKCMNLECILFKKCRKDYAEIDETECDNVQYQIAKYNINEDNFQSEGIEFKSSLLSIKMNDKKETVIASSQVESDDVKSDSNDEKKYVTFSDWMIESEKISTNTVKNYIRGLNFEEKEFEKFRETEQDRVIFAEKSNRMVINAGPGTGKTWTLIEKLVTMVTELEVNPQEILVLCFSRAAIEVIENRLQDAFEEGKIGLNWHSIDIRTFDSFATHLLSWVVEKEKEILVKDFSLNNFNYDERINAATDAISKDKELISQCVHLIVDEVQDLVGSRANFVMQIIEKLPEESGYTLFGDACQSIYDYQVSNEEVDSVKFYSWLFKSQKNSGFWKFIINHRQVSELEIIGNEYRDAILTGDDKARKIATNRIYKQIDELGDLNLKEPIKEDIFNISKNESIGILTRTNGQALKISTWFRTAGIPHKIQKSALDNSLNRWISDIFIDYESDTINVEKFVELIIKSSEISEIKAKELWKILEKMQCKSKNRYYVRDLLYGIHNNAKSKELYTSIGDEKIVISNIHRSKGREYEREIVLNDTLFLESEEEKTIQEHKVSYVAITRAKKKIYRTDICKQYIRTDKKGDGRSYQIGAVMKGRKPRLSHIEIGRRDDIDILSFADNKETQDLICHSNNIVGQSVILVKNREVTNKLGYICYDIVLEEYSSYGVLGRTSKNFYNDLTRIIKDIKGLKHCDVLDYVYPERFIGIYVEDVISVISTYNPLAISGKRYSDMMIWKGIALMGFAQAERDNY